MANWFHLALGTVSCINVLKLHSKARRSHMLPVDYPIPYEIHRWDNDSPFEVHEGPHSTGDIHTKVVHLCQELAHHKQLIPFHLHCGFVILTETV